jgi:phenylacetate-CoA ligase
MAVPGGGQDSPTRLHAIRELGATALVCTPSYGLHLAEVGEMQGLDPAGLGVRTTVHAGEPAPAFPPSGHASRRSGAPGRTITPA